MSTHTQCAVSASDGPRRVAHEPNLFRDLCEIYCRPEIGAKLEIFWKIRHQCDETYNLFQFPAPRGVGGAQYASDKYGTSGGELLCQGPT